MAEATANTYLPDDPVRVAAVHDFMAAHEQRRGASVAERYLLVGAGVDDQVEIPEQVYRILGQVVDAMSRNLAITIAPVNQLLTTQQAADLLGISRPTLVKFLEEGRIPFERVGTHRRIVLQDLLAFRDQHRQDQYESIAATTDEDDLSDEERRAMLKRARRAAARRLADPSV